MTLPRIVLALWFATALSAQAVPVAAPQRFERILWVRDVATTAAKAAEHGFTGVQVGRGVDPQPATDAGIGYYLDQPIGKGVLELRDADFVPLRQSYEKTRDPEVLVRPGCFATPGLVDDLVRDAVAECARVAGPGLRFVALADEPSATRHDAPLDTCWCGHCLTAFRAFARSRYRTIDAFNEAFGSQYQSFDDVSPLSTDQVRRRELGDTLLPRDMRAFAARLDFVDAQYASVLRRLQRAVALAAPGVPVGVTGTAAPAAFGGGDPSRWMPGFSLGEPYAIGGAAELAAGLLPTSAHRYTTLFPPAPESKAASVPLETWMRARLTDMAAHGLAGMVVWNDAAVFGDAGKPSAFGAALRVAIAKLEPVLDACAGAAVDPGPVWIVESQASVRAWWMLDSAADGMTWVRRLSSYEATHSTMQAARRSWIELLRDLGHQPRFVTASALVERLPVERPRCVVLPATIALGDAAVQALTSYVRAGGAVLADHSTAIYDDDLLRRERGALDELFGIVSRSLRWQDLLVREGRLLAGDAKGLPLAERALRGKLAESHRDGDSFAESRPGKGHAVYLNAPVCEYSGARLDPARVGFARELRRRVQTVLMRANCRVPLLVRGEGLPTCIECVQLRLRDGRTVFAIRLAALEDPHLLTTLAQNGPRDIRIDLPAPRHLRLLGGRDLGTGLQFDLRLDPFGGLFLEDLGN